VHAVVDAAELVQREEHAGEEAGAAHRQRIEETDLDVGVRGQRREQLVFTGGIEVVDQQADTHAARRRIAQLAQEAQAGAVLLDLVVLGIDRALGTAHDRQPCIEGEVAGLQQAQSGFAVAGLVEARAFEGAESRRAGVGQRVAR